ncbi:MAG: type II toxin-antitoxin system PemK/MazF family toxin [Lachnospiraceae bacterium]|nr:type II toxin-antitoxin system PemK/MazF family toxin [Lachnospiraceae bacterium]
MLPIEQGDILSVERIKGPVLVVSKNFFNASEMAIVCPIVKNAFPDPLHIEVMTKEIEGVVLCEQMKLLDLRVRGFKKIDRIKYEEVINITDAIQGIFDY